MSKLRILVLEDSLIDAELIVRALRDGGLEFEPLLVANEAEFTAALDPLPDVILSDYSIPGFTAPDALRLLQERALRVPFIVITGSLGDEAAAECIKLGAADYLLKDRLYRLPEAIAQTLEKNRLQIERERAERLKNAIISAALDCVITIDHEGKIIEFNPAAELTFGFKRSEVLGKPMAEHIIPPGLREAHHHGFARLLDTREPDLGQTARAERDPRGRNGVSGRAVDHGHGLVGCAALHGACPRHHVPNSGAASIAGKRGALPLFHAAPAGTRFHQGPGRPLQVCDHPLADGVRDAGRRGPGPDP
jgi:PAS domain S-box-containing protein